MIKRYSSVCLLILLLGGFLWYYHSHSALTTTAYYNLSFTNQEQYSDHMVEFTYPANWQLEQQRVDGDEILHHVSYRELNKQVMGYVQVWAAIKPLPQFLQESRHSPADTTDYIDFSMKQLKDNQYQGYLLAYQRDGVQNSFVAREYFFEHNQRIYRISLFVAKDAWGDYYQQVFDQMITSFKIY
ncbi:PsbP-related protein [Peptococcaceae bacterium 1198_IL3148]